MYTVLAVACSAPERAAAPGRPGPPAAPESPATRAGAADTAALTRDDVEAWLDGYLPYALQRGGIAGAVVVVVKDGAILLQKGYGYADVKARTPVDPRVTLFRPGSIAKLFTWTAVMQLVEQGKLDLDRDVNAYLDFVIPAAFGRPVTLRNCMTHTPGFEEVGKNVFTTDSTRLPTLETFLKAWVPTRVFPPGQVPAYSNYATALAGYIVRRVSGEPFEEYVERHIFAPLDMEYSTFRQPLPDRLRPHMSNGYETATGEPKPFELVGAAPAGSLSAAGEDMGRFMIAHLQDGRFGAGKILEPGTARRMHGTPLTIVPAVDRMLLGFYESNINGHRAIAHAGDTYYFHSDLHLFVDDGVGIYLSLNSLGEEGAAGPIRTALFEQFADRYFPGQPDQRTVPPDTAQAHAMLLAGTYDNSRGSQSSFLSILGLLAPIRVTVNDDTTIATELLTGLDGTPKRWREATPFVWREVGGKDVLGARVEAGKVVMFTADEVSPYMVFLPTPWWKSPVWLVPLVGLSVAAIVLQLALWPVAALVRRRYGASFPLTGRDAAAHRGARLAAAGLLLALVAWGVTFASMLSDVDALTSKRDGLLWALQILSLVVFFGAAGLGLRHAYVVWTGKRGWVARAWSLVLVLACLTLLYAAVSFRLIALDVNY